MNTRFTITDLEQEHFVNIIIEVYKRTLFWPFKRWIVMDEVETYIDHATDNFIHYLIQEHKADSKEFELINKSRYPLWLITNKPYFAKYINQKSNQSCDCLKDNSYCGCKLMLCSRKVGSEFDYKVLGKISHGASWVKEGDQFSKIETLQQKGCGTTYLIKGKDRRYH